MSNVCFACFLTSLLIVMLIFFAAAVLMMTSPLLKGLESEGIKEGKNLKITYKNSQADTATDNQIASNHQGHCHDCC